MYNNSIILVPWSKWHCKSSQLKKWWKATDPCLPVVLSSRDFLLALPLLTSCSPSPTSFNPGTFPLSFSTSKSFSGLSEYDCYDINNRLHPHKIDVIVDILNHFHWWWISSSMEGIEMLICWLESSC